MLWDKLTKADLPCFLEHPEAHAPRERNPILHATDGGPRRADCRSAKLPSALNLKDMHRLEMASAPFYYADYEYMKPYTNLVHRTLSSEHSAP